MTLRTTLTLLGVTGAALDAAVAPVESLPGTLTLTVTASGLARTLAAVATDADGRLVAAAPLAVTLRATSVPPRLTATHGTLDAIHRDGVDLVAHGRTDAEGRWTLVLAGSPPVGVALVGAVTVRWGHLVTAADGT